MNRSLISMTMVAAMSLAATACDSSGTSAPPDDIPNMLDVLHRDKIELTVSYEKDKIGGDGATTFAHTALVMAPRSMAMRLQMRTTSFPAEVLEQFRKGEELTLTVEKEDLQRWVSRSLDLEDYNTTRKMWLDEFVDYYVNTDHFFAICGDTVGRGYFQLKTADGTAIPTIVDILDPIKHPVDPNLATFDWYGDDECVFEWSIPGITAYCKTSSGNGKCEHNVDCPRIKKTQTCISVEVGGQIGHDGKTPTGTANGKYGWKYSEENEMVPVPTYGQCGWQSDITWDLWPFDNCQCWIDRTAACKKFKDEQTADACKPSGNDCNGGTECKK